MITALKIATIIIFLEAFVLFVAFVIEKPLLRVHVFVYSLIISIICVVIIHAYIFEKLFK